MHRIPIRPAAIGSAVGLALFVTRAVPHAKAEAANPCAAPANPCAGKR